MICPLDKDHLLFLPTPYFVRWFFWQNNWESLQPKYIKTTLYSLGSHLFDIVNLVSPFRFIFIISLKNSIKNFFKPARSNPGNYLEKVFWIIFILEFRRLPGLGGLHDDILRKMRFSWGQVLSLGCGVGADSIRENVAQIMLFNISWKRIQKKSAIKWNQSNRNRFSQRNR